MPRYGNYRKRYNELPESPEALVRRAPEYEGYEHSLDHVDILLFQYDKPEKQSVRYMIDNGYFEIKPNVWADSWHVNHPDYENVQQIPESLQRFLANNNMSPSKTAVSISGSSADGDNMSTTSSNPKMNVCDEEEVIDPQTAIEDLQRALDILQTANSMAEPWQHPRELLDATAGAIDEAALCVRSDRLIKLKNSASDTTTQEIIKLSKQVKTARQAYLDASYRTISEDYYQQIMTLDLSNSSKSKRSSQPLVVWATQTGTAKTFAAELQQNLQTPRGKSMSQLTLMDVAMHSKIYFVVSTFGLGRPPRDAEGFFSTLQLQQPHHQQENQQQEGNSSSRAAYHPNKKKNLLLFDGVEFAVAALGNSKFGDFAAFGYALEQELVGLGARPMIKVFPVDALRGRTVQLESFRTWQTELLEMEGKFEISASADYSDSCCAIL